MFSTDVDTDSGRGGKTSAVFIGLFGVLMLALGIAGFFAGIGWLGLAGGTYFITKGLWSMLFALRLRGSANRRPPHVLRAGEWNLAAFGYGIASLLFVPAAVEAGPGDMRVLAIASALAAAGSAAVMAYIAKRSRGNQIEAA